MAYAPDAVEGEIVPRLGEVGAAGDKSDRASQCVVIAQLSVVDARSKLGSKRMRKRRTKIRVFLFGTSHL